MPVEAVPHAGSPEHIILTTEPSYPCVCVIHLYFLSFAATVNIFSYPLNRFEESEHPAQTSLQRACEGHANDAGDTKEKFSHFNREYVKGTEECV